MVRACTAVASIVHYHAWHMALARVCGAWCVYPRACTVRVAIAFASCVQPLRTGSAAGAATTAPRTPRGSSASARVRAQPLLRRSCGAVTIMAMNTPKAATTTIPQAQGANPKSTSTITSPAAVSPMACGRYASSVRLFPARQPCEPPKSCLSTTSGYSQGHSNTRYARTSYSHACVNGVPV